MLTSQCVHVCWHYMPTLHLSHHYDRYSYCAAVGVSPSSKLFRTEIVDIVQSMVHFTPMPQPAVTKHQQRLKHIEKACYQKQDLQC